MHRPGNLSGSRDMDRKPDTTAEWKDYRHEYVYIQCWHKLRRDRATQPGGEYWQQQYGSQREHDGHGILLQHGEYCGDDKRHFGDDEPGECRGRRYWAGQWNPLRHHDDRALPYH